MLIFSDVYVADVGHDRHFSCPVSFSLEGSKRKL